MIVVSNASPKTNLAAIGRFDLLRLLFGEVHLPSAVLQELSAGGLEWPGYKEVQQTSWIEVHQVTNRSLVEALRLDLDRGEAETISLGASTSGKSDPPGRTGRTPCRSTLRTEGSWA